MSEQSPVPSVHPTTSSMQALKRVRTRHFQAAKEEGAPFTGLTSYDMLTAQIFDEAGHRLPARRRLRRATTSSATTRRSR